MSARSLPARPSLRHIKSEAKQLHKELTVGEHGAAERARANLRRLAAGDAVTDVTLQEAQHVLGREYGFKDWQGLAAAAEFTFDDLARLSDQDVERLLREVDQRDLVVALKLASDAVKHRLLTGMTERVRNFINDEIEFLGPVPPDEVRPVQERLVQQVRLLATDAVIGWPPGAETPPPRQKQEPELEPELAVVRQPLMALSVEEIRVLVRALSARQQAHGILSLESAASAAADGFVREGLRLTVDGTEPDLVEDILLTRTRAMLQSLNNRQRITIEAVVAIHSGDNPRIVVHKVLSIYSTDFDKQILSEDGTVDKLRQRLQAQPASTTDLDGFTEIMGNLAEIARRRGVAALAEILDDVDDEFLRCGLSWLTSGSEPASIIEDLESRIPAGQEACGLRYSLFTAGITAIQRGRTGADLEAEMDAQWVAERFRKWL
jgi:flagellar motor component MotA